ncbi:uncharacterized protein LOC109832280 [Asparagus officinalis]|uniref:uncharacterized protein LOC109832280 n=1 Tax=Asparagus officinalis TaxID=4686 RepID=UPI00098E2D53|nr:uncharacterized protein LOC109832280 [Asparagus officinalis]
MKLGRPKIAKRRDPNEGISNINTISRARVSHKCSNCRFTEHTRRIYPYPFPLAMQVTNEQITEGPPSTQRRKFGWHKGSKNVIGQSSEELARNNSPTTTSLVIKRVEGRGISIGRGNRVEGGPHVIGRSRGKGRGRARIKVLNVGYRVHVGWLKSMSDSGNRGYIGGH